MPPKPQFKNTYNIGRAKALKDKVITDPNDPNYKPPDVPVAEPRASYKHTLSSSMILSEEGTQYTIVSKLAIIPAHRRYVKADPDGDTERKRTDAARPPPDLGRRRPWKRCSFAARSWRARTRAFRTTLAWLTLRSRT